MGRVSKGGKGSGGREGSVEERGEGGECGGEERMGRRKGRVFSGGGGETRVCFPPKGPCFPPKEKLLVLLTYTGKAYSHGYSESSLIQPPLHTSPFSPCLTPL